MDNENSHPVHLLPFIDGTPLAIERIRNAWPGLALADRSYLLSVLLRKVNRHPDALMWKRHRNSLIDMALEDENGYIRYLAAKHLDAPMKNDDSEAKARAQKVKYDDSQLVRGGPQEVGAADLPFEDNAGLSALEAAVSSNYNVALFWSCHQIYRLAIAARTSWKFPVADSLRYASKELLPNGTVTLVEMADVLLQFLGRNYERKFATTGGFPRHLESEAEELWNLIPDLPKHLAYILLDCLPGGYKDRLIPIAILGQLDDESLSHLLSRDEIELKELRRQLYFESPHKWLRRAAVSSPNFELRDSDITNLVSEKSNDSRAKQVEELSLLSEHCRGGSLVQMEAVYHFLCQWQSFHYRTEQSQKIQTQQATRLWNDGAGRRTFREAILRLRVFEFAKSLSPVDPETKSSRLPARLQMHQGVIVPRNPWQTYLNLWDAAGREVWPQLEDLPSVWIQDISLTDQNEISSEA